MTARHPRAALVAVAALLPPLLAACSFNGTAEQCSALLGTPVQPTTSDDQQTVVEDGTVAVYEGVACAQSAPPQRRLVTVTGQKALPRWATSATVFLAGWKASYRGQGDHHVLGLATVISGIGLKDGTLTWRASGALSDDSARDIAWCYHYTVVGWNPANVQLTVHDADGSCDRSVQGPASYFFAPNAGATTALSAFPTFLQDDGFRASRTVAILPRGFGMVFVSGDRHLLQLAYRLDHVDASIEGAPANAELASGKSYRKKYDPALLLPVGQSRAGSGFVSWETSAIFKDDSDVPGYGFGEIVSGLGGPDLGVIQPPFSILPREGVGLLHSCLGPSSTLTTEQYVVEQVPYEYAIPMLTGWDLSYTCGDHHVLELGAWIHDFHYEKPPGAPGKLSYKLSYTLRDESQSQGYAARHKVTVLGLKPLPGARLGANP